MHQSNQVEKIFSVLGHPSTKNWDGLEVLHHWHDNTENVRVRKDSHPSYSRLGSAMTEAMRQNLPDWCSGAHAVLEVCVACVCSILS